VRRKQQRKKRRPERSRQKSEAPKHIGFAFAEFHPPWIDLTPEEHAKALEHFGSSVRNEHAQLLTRLGELIRKCNPLQMLAHFAFYDRAMFEIQQGGSYEPLQQHAVEFFQGYFLTVPISELRGRVTPPEVILELNRVLHGLSKTFPMLGIEKRQQSEEKKTAALLSQIVRIHTHGVRNPGYYHQVMHQLASVFSAVDDAYFALRGVKLSALVRMCGNIVESVQQRLGRRCDLIKAMRRRKTARETVLAYSRTVQLGEEDHERLLAQCITSNLSIDEARAMCVHDADRRLIEMYVFSLSDFVAAYPEKVEAAAISMVLAQWSYPPQGLNRFNCDRLFLDNPIWHRPVIQISPDTYFWPSPELFHSFGWEMLEDLLRPYPDLLQAYQGRARADYLEERVMTLCRAGFPQASLWRSCSWIGQCGKRYETDVLLIVDSVALVIECKSARITPAARRGAPERLQREIQKLIEDSSTQSARLAEMLLASDTDFEFTTSKGTHRIPRRAIKRVVRLNVTLDFFGPIACAVRQMVDAKLIDSSVATAATLACTDFENVLRTLETPLERIHYFARRAEIERNLELLADEEDLLACYIATGLNLGDVEFGEHRRVVVSPMGNELQPFLRAMHAGTAATKPRRRFTGWWNQLLTALEERAFADWILIGLVLLDARHEDQRRFEGMVRRMLKNVRSNWRSTSCLNSVCLANGPKERRTAVVAVGVKRITREARRDTMERALAIASEQSQTDDLVIICLNAEKTVWPYTVIAHTLTPRPLETVPGKSAQTRAL